MKQLFSFLSVIIACLALISCGSDEEEPNYPDTSIFVGDTFVIPGRKAVWTSDNEAIAIVENNVVYAMHVGQTTIRNGSKSFKLKVTSKNNLYREPCLQWGSTKAVINNFMSGYTLLHDDDASVTYSGKHREAYTDYTFYQSGLYYSTVAVSPSKVTTKELISYLYERYILYPEDDPKHMSDAFYTLDGHSVVVIFSSDDYYFVVYAAPEVFDSQQAIADFNPEMKPMLQEIKAYRELLLHE